MRAYSEDGKWMAISDPNSKSNTHISGSSEELIPLSIDTNRIISSIDIDESIEEKVPLYNKTFEDINNNFSTRLQTSLVRAGLVKIYRWIDIPNDYGIDEEGWALHSVIRGYRHNTMLGAKIKFFNSPTYNDSVCFGFSMSTGSSRQSLMSATTNFYLVYLNKNTPFPKQISIDDPKYYYMVAHIGDPFTFDPLIVDSTGNHINKFVSSNAGVLALYNRASPSSLLNTNNAYGMERDASSFSGFGNFNDKLRYSRPYKVVASASPLDGDLYDIIAVGHNNNKHRLDSISFRSSSSSSVRQVLFDQHLKYRTFGGDKARLDNCSIPRYFKGGFLENEYFEYNFLGPKTHVGTLVGELTGEIGSFNKNGDSFCLTNISTSFPIGDFYVWFDNRILSSATNLLAFFHQKYLGWKVLYRPYVLPPTNTKRYCYEIYAIYPSNIDSEDIMNNIHPAYHAELREAVFSGTRSVAQLNEYFLFSRFISKNIPTTANIRTYTYRGNEGLFFTRNETDRYNTGTWRFIPNSSLNKAPADNTPYNGQPDDYFYKNAIVESSNPRNGAKYSVEATSTTSPTIWYPKDMIGTPQQQYFFYHNVYQQAYLKANVKYKNPDFKYIRKDDGSPPDTEAEDCKDKVSISLNNKLLVKAAHTDSNIWPSPIIGLAYTNTAEIFMYRQIRSQEGMSSFYKDVSIFDKYSAGNVQRVYLPFIDTGFTIDKQSGEDNASLLDRAIKTFSPFGAILPNKYSKDTRYTFIRDKLKTAIDSKQQSPVFVRNNSPMPKLLLYTIDPSDENLYFENIVLTNKSVIISDSSTNSGSADSVTNIRLSYIGSNRYKILIQQQFDIKFDMKIAQKDGAVVSGLPIKTYANYLKYDNKIDLPSSKYVETEDGYEWIRLGDIIRNSPGEKFVAIETDFFRKDNSKQTLYLAIGVDSTVSANRRIDIYRYDNEGWDTTSTKNDYTGWLLIDTIKTRFPEDIKLAQNGSILINNGTVYALNDTINNRQPDFI